MHSYACVHARDYLTEGAFPVIYITFNESSIYQLRYRNLFITNIYRISVCIVLCAMYAITHIICNRYKIHN